MIPPPLRTLSKWTNGRYPSIRNFRYFVGPPVASTVSNSSSISTGKTTASITGRKRRWRNIWYNNCLHHLHHGKQLQNQHYCVLYYRSFSTVPDSAKSSGRGRSTASLIDHNDITKNDNNNTLTNNNNDETTTNNNNNNAKFQHNLSRLLETSREEWSLIALSASTLLITSSVTLLLPYASGSVIDYTVAQTASTASDGSGSSLSPLTMASGLFGLSTVGGVGVYLRSLWLAQAGNRIVARLKQQLYGSILKQEIGFLDEQTTGDLLSRLTSDAQLVQGALTTQVVAGLRATVMSIGAGGMMIYTSPTLTLVSCATLPPIFVLARYFGRKLSQQQEQVQKLLGDATSLAEESLSHTSTVQQFNAEIFETTRYHNAVANAHTKSVETAHMQAQLEAGTHIAGNAAILGVLGMGGQMVLDGTISAGDLTGFVMYSLLLAGNLSSLTGIYSDVVRAMAASGRIFDLIDRTPRIESSYTTQLQHKIHDESPNPLHQLDYNDLIRSNNTSPNDRQSSLSSSALSSSSSIQLSIISESRRDVVGMDGATVRFDDVSFHYPSRPDVPVLKKFNLVAPPGSVIALVGASGSGKSTVAGLLTRLYDPDDPYNSHDFDFDFDSVSAANGYKDATTNDTSRDTSKFNHDNHNDHSDDNDDYAPITINGVDIRKIDPHHLRRMISVVPQDPVLFRGTIRDNIRYGQWDDVSDDEIVEAARNAYVLDFAMNFPDGLDTLVGPRGMQLSGGQRQRVMLARMLANTTASIYVLDEATSALDAASEHYVQSALQRLFQEHSTDKTIISIAHRLSTIRHATTIAVVDRGQIVQTGTFNDLSTTDGPFRELMKTQLVGEVPA